MIKLLKPETMMNNLKTIENQHLLCKGVALESISRLLADYIDQSFEKIKPTDQVNLDAISYFDYLMLPLLAKDEVFIFNRFVSQYFGNEEFYQSIKELMSKNFVFEDLIELVLLTKRLHEEFMTKNAVFEIRILLCVYYFRNMKELKNLHCELHKLNLAKFDGKSYNDQLSINTLQKEVVANYKLRIESKLNLLNCINFFQKKSTEMVK